MKYVEDKNHFTRPVLEHKISSIMPSNILPKDFNFVYVYVDMSTEEVAYVGRVDSPCRGGRRLHEHRCEKWYHRGEYAIAFIPCLNRFESETIETQLINRYSPKYNKDKKGWGLPIDDNPEGWGNINNLGYVSEKAMDEVGITLALEAMQNNLKEAMVKSGDWREVEVL